MRQKKGIKKGERGWEREGGRGWGGWGERGEEEEEREESRRWERLKMEEGVGDGEGA
jgi:hypothetical protein